jgi:hypothetical protein
MNILFRIRSITNNFEDGEGDYQMGVPEGVEYSKFS